TCTQLWLQTLMLATLSSGNLSPRQLDRAEEWLESWCTKLTLDRVYDSTHHLYWVDASEERGPQRIAGPVTAADPQYLNTKRLHQEIAGARTGIVENSLTASTGWYAENPLKEFFELLDRLQRMWVCPSSPKFRRASVRTPAIEGDRVEVVRGFPGIL